MTLKDLSNWYLTHSVFAMKDQDVVKITTSPPPATVWVANLAY